MSWRYTSWQYACTFNVPDLKPCENGPCAWCANATVEEKKAAAAVDLGEQSESLTSRSTP